MLGLSSIDLPMRTTRDRALEVAGRFREPESLAVTLVKALDAGAEAVLAVPSNTVRTALAELRRPVPVLARLPLTHPATDVHYEHPLAINVPEFDSPGGSWGGARAGFTTLSMLGAALDGELSARVAARCEQEVARFGAREWCGLAVAAPITDLALASGHARFFERMLRFGRSRFGGVAGFETHNLGTLVHHLHEWGIEPDFVLGAVNPRGFAMKPDPASVLAALRRPGIPVLANELRAGGTLPLSEGAAFALEHGAWGLVPDLVDMDEVAAELRRLALTRE